MPSNAEGALELRKVPMMEWLQTFPGQVTVSGFAISLFVAIGSLAWPFGRDQANFAWVADVILNGGAPYRDAWDVKGPLWYYVSALGLGLLGHHAISSRLPDFLAVVVCCSVLRKLVLRVTDGNRFGANGAVICFALLYYANGFWSTAQPDGWGGMLILVAALLLLDSSPRAYWSMAGAGGLIAMAALLKPTFLLFALLPLITFRQTRENRQEHLKLISCSVLALFLTIGAAMLVLSYSSGGLTDFVDLLRFLHDSYVPRQTARTVVLALESVLPAFGLLIPLLLTPIAVSIMRRSQMSREATIVSTWLVLTLLLVVVQRRYWPYHWIPAEIAATALTGVVFAHLDRAQETPRSMLRKQIAAPLICLSVLALPGTRALLENYEWPLYAAGLETRQEYTTQVAGGWDYWTYEKLAAYVAEHSRPDDTMLLWGWDGLVNVLSNRKSPTRFGYSYPLVIPGPLQAHYREVFFRDISRAPPKYIVVDARGSWSLMNKTGLDLMEEFSEFNRFVIERYRFVVDIGAFEVWTVVD